jgi:hypothetical protein
MNNLVSESNVCSSLSSQETSDKRLVGAGNDGSPLLSSALSSHHLDLMMPLEDVTGTATLSPFTHTTAAYHH